MKAKISIAILCIIVLYFIIVQSIHNTPKVGVTVFTGGKETLTIQDGENRVLLSDEEREKFLDVFMNNEWQSVDQDYSLEGAIQFDFGNDHTGYLLKDQPIFYLETYQEVSKEDYQKLLEYVESAFQ